MAAHITNAHLWTARLGTNKQGGHHPLLPRLLPEDGWGRNGEYLEALSQVKDLKVLFEHKSELVAEGERGTRSPGATTTKTGS